MSLRITSSVVTWKKFGFAFGFAAPSHSHCPCPAGRRLAGQSTKPAGKQNKGAAI